MRIVSLLPSATEMVCAVGAESELVGVSHECDWPPSVVGRPVLTSSKVHLAPRSGQIDRDIRALLKDALAVYDIDEAKLAAARPDVIVTQDLCDVCAVSLADVVAAAKKLCRPDVRVVNLRPLRLADIWADIRRVGEALGREREAEAVLADMDRRVADVKRRADAYLAGGAARRNVLTIEWLDPVMVGGTWMPELVELAGGRALVTQAGDHAPTLTREQLAALQPAPDVVVVKPCGFPLDRTAQEADVLQALLAPRPWPAVANGEVWIADGNAFFNRPGPRIVDSLEIMAACVHPRAFADLAARHAGSFRKFGPRP
ncbi:MAG TPA: cobalamin-binding protein [Planctomycetota bacterium]|nr:cobalamin-binding protein [Planctomycetota bacterium]